MKTSIKDIAKSLGVSPSLVSLVLNGKEKESRINKDTASMIKSMALKMNYTPNRFAKGLKKGNSNIIGLIVADISNPFYARLTRFIEDEAEKLNYKIIIGSTDESADKMASIINIMNTYHVDGLIIVPPEYSENQIECLLDANTPILLIDRYFPNMEIDNILVENLEISFKATKHLIEQGCSKIAAISYQSELLHFKDRIQGYKNALIANNLSFMEEDIFLIRFNHLNEDVQKCMDTITQEDSKYDGLFFTTDTLTLKGIKALRHRKIDIPEMFKIVSFDENETFEFLDFDVPHYSQPLNKMGKEAVHLMVSKIETKEKTKPKRIFFDSIWYEK